MKGVGSRFDPIYTFLIPFLRNETIFVTPWIEKNKAEKNKAFVVKSRTKLKEFE